MSTEQEDEKLSPYPKHRAYIGQVEFPLDQIIYGQAANQNQSPEKILNFTKNQFGPNQFPKNRRITIKA